MNKWLLAELHLIQLIPPRIYTPVCNTICPHIELAKGQGKCRMRLKRVLPKGAKCARAIVILKKEIGTNIQRLSVDKSGINQATN